MVVGAGFGGIAAGVKMKRAGIHTFTIYESSLGIGGTWWDNTYPGAEVDVGSHLYSFSFKSHDWTPHPRAAGRAAEVPRGDRRRVRAAAAPAARGRGRVGGVGRRPPRVDGRVSTTAPTDECHVLISGVGFLNVPRYPDWPGLDDFDGPKFHTARWEHQHDLTGKVVAVVGTGSTATQIVPAIQPDVGHLYVFQREPGWVMPKGERDFTAEERKTFSNPWRRRAGAPAAEVGDGEEHLGRQDLPGRLEGERRPPPVLPRLHRPRPSRTAPTCARPSLRRTRTRASGRSSRRRSTRRSRSPTSSWSRRRSRR